MQLKLRWFAVESHQYHTLDLGLVVLFYGSQFAKKTTMFWEKNSGQTWSRFVKHEANAWTGQERHVVFRWHEIALPASGVEISFSNMNIPNIITHWVWCKMTKHEFNLWQHIALLASGVEPRIAFRTGSVWRWCSSGSFPDHGIIQGGDALRPSCHAPLCCKVDLQTEEFVEQLRPWLKCCWVWSWFH